MNEIRADQIANVSLGRTLDIGGQPVPYDGAPVWASTDDAIMTVAVDAADSTKAVCTPANDAGGKTVNVTATVDADLGEGMRQVTGVITWVITGGLVRFVELSVDSLEDKPE